MDSLTQKGLKFISEYENALKIFARIKIAKGANDDDWYAFDMDTAKGANANSNVENTVDVNVWKDESGKWRAAAYPMQINSVNQVQTNSGEFIELF